MFSAPAAPGSPQTSPAAHLSIGALPMALLFLSVAAGWALRGWQYLHSPLVPGINGPYYLIQARAVLEKGTLAVPDLPFTFFWYAALATVLQWAGAGDQADCITLAVKLSDSLLPPLAAVPVFLLGIQLARASARPGWIAPLAAAVIAAAGGHAIALLGDFQKNALGLIWMSGLLFALHRWMARRSIGGACLALAMLGLTGLTHIGVFGCSLLLTGFTCAAYTLLQPSGSFKIPWRWLTLAAGTVALVSALVLWQFDASRIRRLLTAFTSPGDFLSGGMQMPGMPPNAPFLMRIAHRFPTILFYAAAISGAVVAWRRRRTLPPSDLALAFGCAAAVLLITGPWMTGDKLQRFGLIAVLPAMLAGLFAALNARSAWAARIAVPLTTILFVAASLLITARGTQRSMTPDALGEMQTLSRHLPNNGRILIAARHGVEWWTAWTLRTSISQPWALHVGNWKDHDAVFFLQYKAGPFPNGMPGGAHPPGPPPGLMPFLAFGGPPPAGPPPAGAPNAGTPNGVPPPNSGASPRYSQAPGFPDGIHSQNRDNPMGDVIFPDDAEVLHDGKYFKFARIEFPPEYIKEKPAGK